MNNYFSSLDMHYNDFINNRLNTLHNQKNNKNQEYKMKIKLLDELFQKLSKTLPKEEIETLNNFKSSCFDVSNFDLSSAYTLGFMDACQIRKRYD